VVKEEKEERKKIRINKLNEKCLELLA